MKPIGILTFHRASNYGAVLQAYALQKVISDTGREAVIVDYHCRAVEEGHRPWGLFRRHKFPVVLLRCLVAIRKDNIFGAFRRNRLVLSEKMSADDLEKRGDEYALFVTGSDQVWNDTFSGMDPVYTKFHVLLIVLKDTLRQRAVHEQVSAPYIKFFRGLQLNFELFLKNDGKSRSMERIRKDIFSAGKPADVFFRCTVPTSRDIPVFLVLIVQVQYFDAGLFRQPSCRLQKVDVLVHHIDQDVGFRIIGHFHELLPFNTV